MLGYVLGKMIDDSNESRSKNLEVRVGNFINEKGIGSFSDFISQMILLMNKQNFDQSYEKKFSILENIILNSISSNNIDEFLKKSVIFLDEQNIKGFPIFHLYRAIMVCMYHTFDNVPKDKIHKYIQMYTPYSLLTPLDSLIKSKFASDEFLGLSIFLQTQSFKEAVEVSMNLKRKVHALLFFLSDLYYTMPIDYRNMVMKNLPQEYGFALFEADKKIFELKKQKGRIKKQ